MSSSRKARVADRPTTSTRRRRLPVPAVAAAVLVAAGLAGAVYAAGEDGRADVDSGVGSLSAPGLVACSASIAEGRVERTEPVAGSGNGRVRVVLAVNRYYKPADGGEERLTFTTAEPDAEDYYRTGARMLVLVPSHEGETPTAYRDGDAPPDGSGNALEWGRAWVREALPQSRGMECPERG